MRPLSPDSVSFRLLRSGHSSGTSASLIEKKATQRPPLHIGLTVSTDFANAAKEDV